MKTFSKFFLPLSVLFFSLFTLTAQVNQFDLIKENLVNLNEVSDSNEDFKGYETLKTILKDAQIVMLGEESHQDGTAYESKVKLIKYLHEEMDFDVLAFESGFYECNKAWQLMQEGGDIRMLLGKSIYGFWSHTKEFKPLVKCIEENLDVGNPLIIAGFDNKIENTLSKFYVKDLDEYLKKTNILENFEKELEHLNSFMKLILQQKFKKYKKKAAIRDTIFINKLIKLIASSGEDAESSFWQQSLKGIKVYISDMKFGTYYRDYQMAQNLMWLKEQHPNKKIICWGATSHFLYNSKIIRMDSKLGQLLARKSYKENDTMGHYIKEKYKDRAYTIGFIAHEGRYGLGRSRELPLPKENSLESLIGKSAYNNCLLPLNDLSLGEYLSRPLGYFYMKADIAKVMDAVIFNRYMKPATLDSNLHLQIYPENKALKRKVEKRKRNEEKSKN